MKWCTCPPSLTDTPGEGCPSLQPPDLTELKLIMAVHCQAQLVLLYPNVSCTVSNAGLLRHIAGGDPLGRQLREDLRAEPAPPVPPHPQVLGPHAIRRVRGPALHPAAQAVEDGEPRAGGR